LYDMTGRPVKIILIPTLNGQKQLDFSGLPIGTYHLRVMTKDFNQSKKIVINQP